MKEHPVVLLWLKAAEDKAFHAFKSRRRGATSVCGASEIRDVADMDVAGSRSTICPACFDGLHPRMRPVGRGLKQS